MKNLEVIAPSGSSRTFTVRLPHAPQHHGWALRYKSGSAELDAADGPTWISSFVPNPFACEFGDNPVLWDSEADAAKVANYFRKNFELELEVEQH